MHRNVVIWIKNKLDFFFPKLILINQMNCFSKYRYNNKQAKERKTDTKIVYRSVNRYRHAINKLIH